MKKTGLLKIIKTFLTDKISSLSIRTKLIFIITFLIGIIATSAFIYIPYHLKTLAHHTVARKADSIIQMLAYSIKPAIDFDDREAAAEIIDTITQDKSVVYVVIEKTDGNIFAGYNTGYYQSITEDEIESLYMHSAPISLYNKTLGKVHLGLSLKDIDKKISESRRTIGLLSTVTFIICMVIIFIVTAFIINPLKDIVSSVEALADGDYTAKTDIKQKDELGRLAKSFNAMVDKLQEAHIQMLTVNEMLEMRVKERTKELEKEVQERRSIEKALRDSEEKYRKLFEENLAGVYRTTATGYMLECNDSFARIFGYSNREELMEKSAYDAYLSKEDRDEFIDELMKKGNIYGGEYHLKNRFGEDVWTLENVSIDMDEDPPVIFGTMFDITERKITENALKESEEKHRSLIELFPHFIGIISKFEILFASSAALKTFKISSSKILGMNILSLVDSSEKDLFKDAVETYMNSGKGSSEQFITVFRKANGTLFPAEVYLKAITFEGKKALQIMVMDITERVKTEEERLKADKFNSIGLLAGGIAHDFQNMLTSMMTNINIAMVQSESSEETQERLQDIEKAIIRARNLTNQLQSFSKEGVPNREIVSIEIILKDTVEFALAGSKITPIWKIDKDLYPVNVDPGQISQLTNNIIINAKQAMDDTGKITITAKNLDSNKEYRYFGKGKYLKISIKDEGCGIPGENISRVFDPYFTTKEEGSGLGLPTAYSIIQRHDGDIRIKSEVNKGTEVIIYLPAVEAEEIEQGSTGRKAKGKILFVDDDDLIRKSAKEIFKYLDFNVITVETVEEALKAYKDACRLKHPFDAVIMDIVLKGKMNGIDAIKKIKKINPDVITIASSSYSRYAISEKYEDYGFDGYIKKPYRIANIEEVLDQLLKEKNKTK